MIDDYLFPPIDDLDGFDFESCYKFVKKECWILISNRSVDVAFDYVGDAVRLYFEKSPIKYSALIHHKETDKITRIMFKLLYKDLDDG